jgi:hypothetical protein
VERHGSDPMKPIKTVMKDRYPLFLLEAVDWAMEMDTERRPQDAGELLRGLRRFAGEVPTSRLSESFQTDSASRMLLS